jgi:hypothetical protein
MGFFMVEMYIISTIDARRLPRQCDLGAPRLDRDNAKTCGAGKALGVDGFGGARWVEGAQGLSSF